MNSHYPSPTTTLQDQIDAYWTGRAEAYHAHQLESERAPYDRALWRRVWAEALPEGHLRIADMGTGSGYVANLLADAGHQVTGVDSSPGMITAAEAETQRRRDAGLPTAEFLAGDAINPPLADASVDAVTSRYLLWTLTDPVAALRSWSRLVVPGGIIACVDAPWFPHGISEETEVVSEDGPDAFTRTYHPGTLEHLPLAEAQGAEDFAAVFTAAGLIDVTVTPIPEVNELDRSFELSPGHESSPQYVVTGRVAEKEQ